VLGSRRRAAGEWLKGRLGRPVARKLEVENAGGLLVPKDQAREGHVCLYKEEAVGGEVWDITFTITNLVQP
jgi:hypothetical protein